MAKQKFGGAHTVLKLEKLENYLRSYTTALRKQNFELVFFDAFAGTGDIDISDDDKSQFQLFAQDDHQSFTSGSAHRALSLNVPFDKYIFVEKSKSKADDLEKLKTDFPTLASRINIQRGEANAQLAAFCENTNWTKTRAVVFLDPFGNQVSWQIIEAIAKTKAIDLWYLFPAGLGVHRQIGKDGSVHFTHGASLDKVLGTPDWRTAFIEETDGQDLFGPFKKIEKIATPHSITMYMINRMKGCFDGGVVDDWLRLGSGGVHMYSLLFAWANPSEKARLAGKLAQAVLRNGPNGGS